jgi:ketosteroid isomerase-like protein
MGSIHTRILAFLLAMSVANVCLGVHRDALALTRGAVAWMAPDVAGTTDETIKELLTRQAEAWNRGDIDEFMQGYRRSDELTFSGSSGLSRGWQTVLERYHRSYPDRATMGHLEFSKLEITVLGDDAALILGNWHLDRESGPVGGVFTLVARRFPEGWRIIHDHTSTVANENRATQ